MTARLLAIDLLITVLIPAVWTGAAVVLSGVRGGRPERGRFVAITVLTAAGALLIGARVAVAVALAGQDWAFAQDKLLLALPLALAAAVWALVVLPPVLITGLRGPVYRRRTRRALPAVTTTAATGVLGVLTTFVIGYPVSWVDQVLWTVVIGCVAATALLLTRERRFPYAVPAVAAVAIMSLLAPLAVAFSASFVGPGDHHANADGGSSAMAPAAAHAGHGSGVAAGRTAAPAGANGVVSVSDLRLPATEPGPVRRFEVTARQQTVTLPSGTTVDAWTFGSLPGPQIRVQQGDLVEVVLHNADIAEGVSLHWHGYHVPNGDDGVAGVTQDAVLPGQSFTYRFRADDPGTYWYHTHQVSSDGVPRGLYGVLIVEPAPAAAGTRDVVLPIHTQGPVMLLGDSDQPVDQPIPANTPVRLRLINTDLVPHRIAVSDQAFRVVAADGQDLSGPTEITGTPLRLPAGGRLDVELTLGTNAVSVTVEGAPQARLTLIPPGFEDRRSSDQMPTADTFAQPDLDLLTYGAPTDVVAQAMAVRPDVERTLVLDRLLRFRSGIPNAGYTVDGKVFPDVPSVLVEQGDLVKLTVVNRSGEPHPMHPHGHHVLVLSRNGVPASGSPLWLDSFDVLPGDVWQVALWADNPGIWMSHCHNFDHAAGGMVLHLNYRGVTTPFDLGGPAGNEPE